MNTLIKMSMIMHLAHHKFILLQIAAMLTPNLIFTHTPMEKLMNIFSEQCTIITQINLVIIYIYLFTTLKCISMCQPGEHRI